MAGTTGDGVKKKKGLKNNSQKGYQTPRRSGQAHKPDSCSISYNAEFTHTWWVCLLNKSSTVCRYVHKGLKKSTREPSNTSWFPSGTVLCSHGLVSQRILNSPFKSYILLEKNHFQAQFGSSSDTEVLITAEYFGLHMWTRKTCKCFAH